MELVCHDLSCHVTGIVPVCGYSGRAGRRRSPSRASRLSVDNVSKTRVCAPNLRYFSIFPFPDVVGRIRLLTLGVFVGIFVSFKALIG